MILHYLKIACRNLLKYKTQSIISILGLAIGFTLVLVHIVCIPITGTSVNPARSIAPALFQGGEALSQLWLFIIAPFVGAALSAVVWNYLGDKEEKK